MNHSNVMHRTVTRHLVMTLAAVAAAVLLPQLFHAVGAVSGAGAAVGAAFLPMHLPVLLAAWMAGPTVGLAAGVLSPLVSFGISGMPTAVLLPFMMLELGVYGFVFGKLRDTKLPVFVQLLLTQLAGRAARAAAVLAIVSLQENTKLTVASAYVFVLEGLFGILLQWALIPLATAQLRTKGMGHE